MMADMTVQQRQAIERRIIKKLVRDVIAAGHAVSVNDGEEITVKASRDVAVIMQAVMTTDEDYLLIHQADRSAGLMGSVRLVYGNDGWDVICDYSTRLDALMTGAQALADKIEGEAG